MTKVATHIALTEYNEMFSEPVCEEAQKLEKLGLKYEAFPLMNISDEDIITALSKCEYINKRSKKNMSIWELICVLLPEESEHNKWNWQSYLYSRVQEMADKNMMVLAEGCCDEYDYEERDAYMSNEAWERFWADVELQKVQKDDTLRFTDFYRKVR